MITYKEVQPGEEAYMLLIKNTAYTADKISYVLPAREVQKVLSEPKAARTVRIAESIRSQSRHHKRAVR